MAKGRKEKGVDWVNTKLQVSLPARSVVDDFAFSAPMVIVSVIHDQMPTQVSGQDLLEESITGR